MKQLLTVCAAPASATPEEVRPRERLDMTPQDRVALGTPYAQCLAEHGVDKKSAPQPKEVIEKAAAAVGERRRQSGIPRLRQPRCAMPARQGSSLRRGVQRTGIGTCRRFVWWPNNDQQSITLGLQHTRECEIEASKR